MKKHLTRDVCPNCGHGAILQQGVGDSGDGVRTIAIMWFCGRCGTVRIDDITQRPYCEPLDPKDDGKSPNRRVPASWWREPIFAASLLTLASFMVAVWFFFGTGGLLTFMLGVLVMTSISVMNLRDLVRAGDRRHEEDLP